MAYSSPFKKKKAAERAKKLVSAELKALEKNCTNRASIDALDRLANEDYTHAVAAMDSQGNIPGKVDLIKDEEHDSQVSAIHNRTGEGVIVVED